MGLQAERSRFVKDVQHLWGENCSQLANNSTPECQVTLAQSHSGDTWTSRHFSAFKLGVSQKWTPFSLFIVAGVTCLERNTLDLIFFGDFSRCEAHLQAKAAPSASLEPIPRIIYSLIM